MGEASAAKLHSGRPGFQVAGKKSQATHARTSVDADATLSGEQRQKVDSAFLTAVSEKLSVECLDSNMWRGAVTCGWWRGSFGLDLNIQPCRYGVFISRE